MRIIRQVFTMATKKKAPIFVDGFVKPGFEKVKERFRFHFIKFILITIKDLNDTYIILFLYKYVDEITRNNRSIKAISKDKMMLYRNDKNMKYKYFAT